MIKHSLAKISLASTMAVALATPVWAQDSGSDTGGDIIVTARRTEERLQDVFDFGFTHKNGRVGLRLGLPTSKLTVDELGGEISIQSVPGEGTSVHLRLPA